MNKGKKLSNFADQIYDSYIFKKENTSFKTAWKICNLIETEHNNEKLLEEIHKNKRWKMSFTKKKREK